MNPATALAALCGIVLGTGLWLVVVRLPAMRPPTLTQRVAPQLRAVDVRSRLLSESPANVTPFGPLERILRPLLADAVSWSHRFNPAAATLARRLAQAGRGQTTTDFRAQQLLWAAGGLAGSTLVMVLLAASGSANIPLAVVIILACAVMGFVGPDYVLSSDIRRREARMLAEFPSLAELMALAVSAGESTTGALERICRTASGELAGEFALVLAATRAGKPLVDALQEFSHRTRLAPLSRFVDGITVAVQRGTPLADVLRAQAQDVRDLAKRDLMESAGRKEIAMMVPVVN
ncbi:type II secretion system F family protein [Arthrobacter burdickii]|uniref:Type II secretion system F family protein n=1 Tax=Arthrobacter burdickii TaxID=3035920 RepID=A0ABT8K2L4_9MICC|nr:type II secretion system F family protein [Arthrobacter burdickii]MDN4611071.1 type II secretion system F family protein [Arthrobacter burdickii]